MRTRQNPMIMANNLKRDITYSKKMINEGKIIGPGYVINIVINALRNLQDTKGTTVKKILKYVSQCYPKRAGKRKIIAALKRGVEFGIMKQKRRHYFLPKSDISRPGLKSLELHSSIPLSVRRANIRSRGVKKPERKRQYFGMSQRKDRKVLRKETRKKRSPTKSYTLSDMYYNPNYKDSASSVGFTEDFRDDAQIPENDNL